MDFCRIVQREGGKDPPGISMAGAIPGVYSSSTRAELASVIAALAKPGPLHIALDNWSAVAGMLDILEGTERSKRPWALRLDGDLWAVAEQAIAARGANSVTIAWTKGHANWLNLLNGTSTYRDAIGNGFADAAADHGHRVTDRLAEQRILDNIAATQKSYAKFTGRLPRYALAIIAGDKIERERRSFQPIGKTGTIKWMPIDDGPDARPAFDEGSRLELLSLPRSLEDSLAEASIFWRNTHWQNHGPPKTWLELYALFRLWGGGDFKEAQDIHSPTRTFKHGLTTFINNSKAYLTIAGTPATKQAVQAYQGNELLMGKVGIFIRATAISATLCLAPEVNSNIHLMLIDIRKAKGENGKDMIKGSSQPLPKLEPWSATLKKIREARAAKGSPSIPSIAQKNLTSTRDNISLKGQRGDNRDVKPGELILSCPRCSATNAVAKCTLYSTAAKVLSCLACKTSSSTRWNCNHCIPWPSCPIHWEAGFRCAGGVKPLHSKTNFLFKESKIKARVQRHKKLGHLGCKDS
jgi:hypothetical protein